MRYNKSMIRVIVGLGNPGEPYTDTYHNIGMDFVEAVVSGPWKRAPRKHFVYAEKDGVSWIKPLVFMNESGSAVQEAAAYFKKGPDELLVIHDDSDLPWGTHKMAFDSGTAGHKGVASIIDALGTKAFWRLRVGIRPKADLPAEARRAKAGEFVLRKLSSGHKKERRALFKKLMEVL